MVTFDSISHTYYVDGKPRESVSHFIGRHKKPFPKEMIAQKTAKRDGREAEDILSEWDIKGRVSREYGTAVHTAIEGYITHKMTPSIDHLKNIVEAFQKIQLVDPRSEFVTYNDNLAGTMDIVDQYEKGKCDIYDLKTNGDLYKKGSKMLPPYEFLTDSPIDTYRLQLSLYADMMEFHGWEVRDLIILHIAGETIKPIKIERV